ncbi:hypothetical protein [Rhizobacter sp. Root1221]|uniref:hypothetical protein n=1 Tax=Rhizobacter sp. Root1221 TaxID=1736433 RepID=UPI0006FC18DF|nr:hypothetical protein [Rhizobacter sp. Root1221]KQW00117.1 hypothetical protein ASC87_19055 [Rhizobacter sp. Root1221]
MHRIAAFLLLSLAALACAARAPTGAERKAILDAARAVAAAKASQPVRLKVESLFVDDGWALLQGELYPAPGATLDWELTSCAPGMDKRLWVVLNQADGPWQVRLIDICDAEPLAWGLHNYGGIQWPCGVYEGMLSADGHDLEAVCRARRKAPLRPGAAHIPGVDPR